MTASLPLTDIAIVEPVSGGQSERGVRRVTVRAQ